MLVGSLQAEAVNVEILDLAGRPKDRNGAPSFFFSSLFLIDLYMRIDQNPLVKDLVEDH